MVRQNKSNKENRNSQIDEKVIVKKSSKKIKSQMVKRYEC